MYKWHQAPCSTTQTECIVLCSVRHIAVARQSFISMSPFLAKLALQVLFVYLCYLMAAMTIDDMRLVRPKINLTGIRLMWLQGQSDQYLFFFLCISIMNVSTCLRLHIRVGGECSHSDSDIISKRSLFDLWSCCWHASLWLVQLFTTMKSVMWLAESGLIVTPSICIPPQLMCTYIYVSFIQWVLLYDDVPLSSSFYSQLTSTDSCNCDWRKSAGEADGYHCSSDPWLSHDLNTLDLNIYHGNQPWH